MLNTSSKLVYYFVGYNEVFLIIMPQYIIILESTFHYSLNFLEICFKRNCILTSLNGYISRTYNLNLPWNACCVINERIAGNWRKCLNSWEYQLDFLKFQYNSHYLSAMMNIKCNNCLMTIILLLNKITPTKNIKLNNQLSLNIFDITSIVFY